MEETTEKTNIFKIITEPKRQFELLRRRPKIVIPLLIVFLIGIVNIVFGLTFNPDVSEEISESNSSLVLTTVFNSIMGIFGLFMVIVLRAVVLMIIMAIVEPGEDIQYPITITLYSFIVVQIGALISTTIAFFIDGNPGKNYTSLGAIYASDMSTQDFVNDIQYILLESINPFTIWMLVLVFIGIKVLYKTTTTKAVVATVLFYILPLLGSMLLGSLLPSDLDM
ncbi:YIP1 family protein [Aliicoccus persicus]|uniref:Yip1 domain-containing protein n=1 Tax=Aliicoccus persicus TaxID=930138 RepID=A0A662Z570_9STAP|nr:YIP1 family protein [Aliicoccus persicus]SEV96813.1 Yip1 domain-containing protein [Aliicoccus persicus]